MEDEHLTLEQCDELAEALVDEAASLRDGANKENLLNLAKGYRNLARMKSVIARKVN